MKQSAAEMTLHVMYAQTFHEKMQRCRNCEAMWTAPRLGTDAIIVRADCPYCESIHVDVISVTAAVSYFKEMHT